jgi:hypothetical protein
MFTLIAPENPFAPAAVMVTGWAGPPADKLMEVGLVLSEKSGAALVPETLPHPQQQRIAARKPSQSGGSAQFAFMATVVHPELNSAQPEAKAHTFYAAYRRLRKNAPYRMSWVPKRIPQRLKPR